MQATRGNMVQPCRPHVTIWYSNAGHTWQYGTAMQAMHDNIIRRIKKFRAL